MKTIMEHMILASDEEIQRYISILDAAISDGEIKSTASYKKSKKELLEELPARLTAAEKEAKEAEELLEEITKKKTASKEDARVNKLLIEGVKKKDNSDLMMALKQKHQNQFQSLTDRLAAKYGVVDQESDLPDDEEFEKIQKKMIGGGDKSVPKRKRVPGKRK